MYFLRFTFLLMGLGLAISASGQRPYQRLHELFYGREDYQVTSILQDSAGILWFGTDRGLIRYDGFGYERFTVSDGLADDRISSLCWVHKASLWIGHANGTISLYNGKEFIPFEPDEGLGRLEITDLLVDPSGMIWFSTLGEGLFRYNGRYLANFDMEDGLSDNYIYDIELDPSGGLWLATDYGISHYSGDTFEQISMSDGLPDNIVRVVNLTGDQLWLGTDESGVSSLDVRTGQIRNYGNWLYGPVTGLVVDPGKKILVSTENMGLIEMNLEDGSDVKFRQITQDEGLISNHLNTLIRDFEENIWIGGRRGIVQMLPPLFEFMDMESGLPFERANSLLKDNGGNMWVCSENGLFRGVPNESGRFIWENISESLQLDGMSFISLYEDSNHDIWAGSLGRGLVVINPDNMSFTWISKASGLSDDNIINITGYENLVWISTLGGGLNRYDLKQEEFTHFNQSALKGNYIYSTQVDPQMRIWVAASLHFPHYIWDDSLHVLEGPSYVIPPLWGIAIDSSGEVWFNTLSDGILKLGEQGVEHFGPEQGVDLKDIQSIVFDKHDNLLIFANSGLQILDTESGNSIYLDEKAGLGYRYPLLNAVYEDRDDQIWFGTQTGIIKYNPEYLYITEQKPRVHLTLLHLFDSPIDRGLNSFGHRSNNFTFGFTGLWYKFPEMQTFRYQLEGYDLDWNYSRRNRQVTYPRLPPGNYTFRVEVSVDGRNWNGIEQGRYSFIIDPPFWLKWWFIIGVLVSAALILLLYIRLRLANLERAKRELEKQVKLRTEQIANKNLMLESQTKEIAKQRDYAEAQRDQITYQRDEIQSSITYARRIQFAALPPEGVMSAMLEDYFIYNRPRNIVSGDFYWAARGNTCIYFAVADCTGHGVPGAFLSILGISSLNEIIKTKQDLSPSEVLDQLARRIRESLHQTDSTSGDTSVDGMDIALCSYQPGSGQLQFAGANNHFYLVREAEMQIIRADMQDISSKYESPGTFTNHRIKVYDGDLIYLFTDGFPDQFGGEGRKKYMYGRFRKLLMDIHQESMSRQEMLLSMEFNQWKGNNEQIDDVLIMGVKIRQA